MLDVYGKRDSYTDRDSNERNIPVVSIVLRRWDQVILE